ncbi:MAG: C45 family autoproteolytic acyltransferase/hydrolase [Thermomicrobiales bacterium]
MVDRVTLRASGPGTVLVLAGKPRERGYEHGRLARTDIATNLATVRRNLAAYAARGRAYDYDRVVARNQRFLQRTAPDVLDEIMGIADGADLPFQDVLLLNVPVFLAGQFLPQECTQILLPPPVTATGRTYHAKTRDFNHESAFRQVVLQRRDADGRETIEVHTAGTITWPGSGINSDGVTISTSGVWSGRQTLDLDRAAEAWFLINPHLLLRQSRTVEDVWEALQAQPRITGLNIVVSDGKRGAAFEATADGEYRHDSEEGGIVRTNHYLTPEIRRLGPTQRDHPSSYHRHQRAAARIEAQRGQWDFSEIVALVGDHDGYPQSSICRHSQGGESADTVYASIATLPAGDFWTIMDHPCMAEVPAGEAAALAGR